MSRPFPSAPPRAASLSAAPLAVSFATPFPSAFGASFGASAAAPLGEFVRLSAGRRFRARRATARPPTTPTQSAPLQFPAERSSLLRFRPAPPEAA
jgi:hypothetical protein